MFEKKSLVALIIFIQLCVVYTQQERCFDFSNWVDSGGDSCSWYDKTNSNRCNIYGNQYKANGSTARQACCACGGGVNSRFWPSATPTQAPTVIPTIYMPCLSDPNFMDEDGYNCEAYSDKFLVDDAAFLNGEDRCASKGNETNANIYCCECGGGSKYLPSSLPTTSSRPTDAIEPSAAPVEIECIDISGWVDSSKVSCSEYTTNKCEKDGESFSNRGLTANKACCQCGGGLNVSEIIFSMVDRAEEKKLSPIEQALRADANEPPPPLCIDIPRWQPDLIMKNLTCSNFNWKKDESKNLVTCEQLGHLTSVSGFSAKESCCICGGGYMGDLIGRTFRVSYASTSDNHRYIYYTDENDRKNWNGTLLQYLQNIGEATGFAFYEVPLTESSLDVYPNDFESACEADLILGYTDVCLGTYWSNGEEKEGYSDSLFSTYFYPVVKRIKETAWDRFLAPIAPFKGSAWLFVLLTCMYVSAVMNLIQRKACYKSPHHIFTMFGDALYHGIRNFTTGEVTNEDEKERISERVVVIGFGMFGLIILTAYTATSAAFLISRKFVEFESFDEILDTGATICIHNRAFDAFLAENPEAGGTLYAVNLKTTQLLEHFMNGVEVKTADGGIICDSVVVAEEAYMVSINFNEEICQNLKMLRSEALLEVGNVIPTYSLLESWSDELVTVINRGLTTNIFPDLMASWELHMNEYFEDKSTTHTEIGLHNYLNGNVSESLRRRVLKGGKGGASSSAGGSASGGQSGGSICGGDYDVNLEIYSLGAKHLVFPICIAFVASTIALVMFFSNEKRVVAMKNALSSTIFGKNIEMSTQEMQFLLTVQVEDMEAVEMYEKLREAGVDERDLSLALDDLPDKRKLIDLFKNEFSFTDEWSVQQKLNILSISELVAICNFCSQKEISSTKAGGEEDKNQLLSIHALNNGDDPHAALVKTIFQSEEAKVLAVSIANKKENHHHDNEAFDISKALRKDKRLIHDEVPLNPNDCPESGLLDSNKKEEDDSRTADEETSSCHLSNKDDETRTIVEKSSMSYYSYKNKNDATERTLEFLGDRKISSVKKEKAQIIDNYRDCDMLVDAVSEMTFPYLINSVNASFPNKSEKLMIANLLEDVDFLVDSLDN